MKCRYTGCEHSDSLFELLWNKSVQASHEDQAVCTVLFTSAAK